MGGPDLGIRRLDRFVRILNADDLVTIVNYNDTAKTSVSGVEYVSDVLNYNAYETFASGTYTLTITRTKDNA